MAECIAAMLAAVRIPVTVKCRLGVDEQEDYASFLAFVDTVAATGCENFIVHARKAWLQRPVAEGEPRDPAAALRLGAPAQARAPAV